MFRLPRGEDGGASDGDDRGPFDPPVLSVSGRTVRVLRASEDPVGALEERPVTSAREELWYGDEGSDASLRAWLEDERHLVVTVRSGELVETRRLLRIPLGEGGTEGRRRYFGRWEHGKDRAVLSPKGAGVILGGDRSSTVAADPVLVDAVHGEGLLLGLKGVPNGVRILDAEGIPELAAGAVLSEIQVPEVEAGPRVEVHPREAALCGFAPIGFRGHFSGLPFGGFARALGDGSADLARFLKRPSSVARGAVRPHAAPPDERDAYLEAALRRELAPKHTLGRTRVGAAATIGLSDGRSYRVRVAALERLPRGEPELLIAALLPAGDGALELRLAVPTEQLEEPTAEVGLAYARGFLVAFEPWRLEPGRLEPGRVEPGAG